MLSCCQTASRLRNGKNCCSLKITEGGISPRVSASPGQQNEFFHPVIPNIRDIRGAESNGDRGGNPRFPRSKVYNAGEEFVRKHRERLQRNITGARVVSSCKFTFLLLRCFATFSYSPFPPLSFLLLLFSFLFISLDQRARWKISGRYSFLQGNRRGPVIEFI